MAIVCLEYGLEISDFSLNYKNKGEAYLVLACLSVYSFTLLYLSAYMYLLVLQHTLGSLQIRGLTIKHRPPVKKQKHSIYILVETLVVFQSPMRQDLILSDYELICHK